MPFFGAGHFKIGLMEHHEIWLSVCIFQYSHCNKAKPLQSFIQGPQRFSGNCPLAYFFWLFLPCHFSLYNLTPLILTIMLSRHKRELIRENRRILQNKTVRETKEKITVCLD